MIKLKRSTRKVDTTVFNSEEARSPILFVDVKSRGLTVMFALAFLVLVLFTAQVSLSAGSESSYLAEGNLLREQLTSSPRGLFYDVNGNKLVQNELSYSLQFDPSGLSEEELDYVLTSTSDELDTSKEKLAQRIDDADLSQSFFLATRITSEQVVLLEDKLKDFDIDFVPEVHRDYLFPDDFAHVIGYTGEASEEDVANGKTAGDEVGKYRLEKVLDEQLSGIKGKEIQRGDLVEEILGIPGNNIFLTIDLKWQKTLNNILENQLVSLGADAGAAVIVDVDSGDIRAYSGYPSFNANEFAVGISQKQYSRLTEADGNPLVDKVVGLQAAPGSTFKILTALSLLQNDTVNADTIVNSTGCMDIGNYKFCEYGDFYLGPLNIRGALTKSSNIYFCTGLLEQVSEDGYEGYLDLANQLGIGVPTGIDIDGELAGVMASPEYKQTNFGERWFGGDTCNTAIGQGMIATTPLQMAMLVSTIANGGDYYQPNLIERIVDQSGNLVEDDFTRVLRTIEIDEDVRSLVLAGMRDVVTSPQGTAYRFLNDMPGNFRAKTGSAEAFESVDGKLESRVHGWVVGTFEYDGHTYAFSVHLHFGGGGWNTTPVIQRFANCLFSDFKKGCEHL